MPARESGRPKRAGADYFILPLSLVHDAGMAGLCWRELRVLLAVSAHFGKNSACWPGVDRLAALAKVQRRGVLAAPRQLERAGWLTRGERRGSWHRGHRWGQRLAWPGAISPDAAGGSPLGTGADSPPESRRERPQGMRREAHDTANNPVRDRSMIPCGIDR